MEEKTQPEKVLDAYEKYLDDTSSTLDKLDKLLKLVNQCKEFENACPGENTVKYVVKKLRCGHIYIDITPKIYVVLTSIFCDPENEIINIPSLFFDEQEALTHIGYEEIYEEGYERWIDWHHNKSDYYPPCYKLKPIHVHIPDHVKKIVIPNTVTDISDIAFENAKNVIFEVHPDNTHYEVVDNKIVPKK